MRNHLFLKLKNIAKYHLSVEAMSENSCKLLGDNHLDTLETWNDLIALYEAWGKQEKAEEWRAKLPQKEGKIE